MKSDHSVRHELSAWLDGELDRPTSEAVRVHLDSCSECRSQAQRLQRVRQLARVQPSVRVPDLVDPIMVRIGSRTEVRRWPQVRTATIAAAAAALIVLGASLPWTDEPGDTARATEIVHEVRAAARQLQTVHARFSVTERGWHPMVSTRRFRAEVFFDAPERFRLEVQDLTAYPSDDWPRNIVELTAGPRRYRIAEPSTCPTEALPGCVPSAPREERTVIDRQPFDGNSRLPTDIAVPLETLASSAGVQVLAPTRFLDRDVQRVLLPYRQALPLVAALQPGGSWREFHPLDPVEIWIDSATWFPLRFEVRVGDSPDRRLWADRVGVAGERAGAVILDVRATGFDDGSDLPAGTFRSSVRGAVQDGGFTPIAFEEVADQAPRFTAGLRPYRAGVTPFGQTILSYERGMNYLKVSDDSDIRSGRAYAGPAQAIRLGDGEALYQPATERSGRRIDIYSANGHVGVETNLPRAQLVAVATSLGIEGHLPVRLRTQSGQVIRRITPGTDPQPRFAFTPGWLPSGFRHSASLLTRSANGRSLTTYYQRPESSFGGFGIRIVQTPAIDVLPPGAEETLNVRIHSTVARWSFERSELEWIEAGTYRSVATADGDLATAVQIARNLK
ncbi:MAG TPA: anti-sigma factor [Actinomycetota bacterium]|nr:anti-sigma factor [Actinomycetota bacterium]